MKKLLTVLLLLISILCITSCGDNEEKNEYIIDKEYELDNTNLVGDYRLASNTQDGVILHAWNWSYDTIKENLEDIAKAGYSTVQTSPVQMAKCYSKGANEIDSCWWKLYQPISYTVGDCWLGDSSDLEELCTEAHKYGIKIICDIVFNHLANNGGTKTQNDISPEIEKYEPEIYRNQSKYFHSITSNYVTQSWMDGALPDVNTSNEYIQSRALSLLKECVDLGVDGFRFDAAKHIETDTDSSYASSFWPTVLDGAQTYATQTQNKTLYYYGEVLGGADGGRSVSAYTKYMSVTDDGDSGNMLMLTANRNLTDATNKIKITKGEASKMVLWVESHDTYSSTISSGSNAMGNAKVTRSWAMVANRAEASALYFVRPGEAKMGECGTYEWQSDAVVAVNHFHNEMIGATEEYTFTNNYSVGERYRSDGKTGAIIINCSTKENNVSISVPVKHLEKGIYIDAVSGNEFVCDGMNVTGVIGTTGVVVLMSKQYEKNSPSPKISFDIETTCYYPGQTISVKVNVLNANQVSYYFEGDESNVKSLEKTGGTIELNSNKTIVVTAEGNITVSKSKQIEVTQVASKYGYWAIAGLSSDLVENYTILAWVWPEKGSSSWRTVEIIDGVAYVKKESTDYGILIAKFAKGTTIKTKNTWDGTSSKCISQSADYGKPLKEIPYTSTLE